MLYIKYSIKCHLVIQIQSTPFYLDNQSCWSNEDAILDIFFQSVLPMVPLNLNSQSSIKGACVDAAIQERRGSGFNQSIIKDIW